MMCMEIRNIFDNTVKLCWENIFVHSLVDLTIVGQKSIQTSVVHTVEPR